MADTQLLEILFNGGAPAWNRWMQEHPNLRPDLSNADLRNYSLRHINLASSDLSGTDFSGADLSGGDLHDSDLSNAKFCDATLTDIDMSRSFGPVVDFSRAVLRNARFGEGKFTGMICDGADMTSAECDWSVCPNATFVGARLYRANFSHSYLDSADFSCAKLQGANFYQSNLGSAKFMHTQLRGTNLNRTDLAYANFTDADLREAHMEQATLMETCLQGAKMSGSYVYGIAVWDVIGEPASQLNLVIRPPERDDAPAIIVDDLEIAQFIYLITNRQKLRNVLTSISNRGVLLLGPFKHGGLARLEAIAGRLRAEPFNYLPIIFDFKRPDDRSYTETVITLVGLSRFVIVDLSGPSVPLELEATVNKYKLPFVPIIEKGKDYASMVKDLGENDWFLYPPVEFSTEQELIDLLPDNVIAWAEARREMRLKRLVEIYSEE